VHSNREIVSKSIEPLTTKTPQTLFARARGKREIFGRAQ